MQDAANSVRKATKLTYDIKRFYYSNNLTKLKVVESYSISILRSGELNRTKYLTSAINPTASCS